MRVIVYSDHELLRAIPYLNSINCGLDREDGVQTIMCVLKDEGWRRGSGDLTVFPMVQDVPQFNASVVHYRMKLEGRGALIVPHCKAVSDMF